MLRSQTNATRASESTATAPLRGRGTLIAGAILLGVGLAGFASTIRYEHVEAPLAPLSPVEAIVLREAIPSDLGELVANLTTTANAVPVAEVAAMATEEPAPAASPAQPRPNVAAAAATGVTLLPTPTAVPSVTPSPTPTVAPRPAQVGGGNSGGGASTPSGVSATSPGDGYASPFTDQASPAPEPVAAPPRTDVPRDIDPTRPMPR